jgi:hypothetical protein
MKGTSGKGAALRIEHGCSSSKQKLEAQKKKKGASHYVVHIALVTEQ